VGESSKLNRQKTYAPTAGVRLDYFQKRRERSVSAHRVLHHSARVSHHPPLL